MAPFSGYIHSLELELLPDDLRPLYSGYIGSTLVIPAESALGDIRLIIPNLSPSLDFSTTFISSGEMLESFTLNEYMYVHVEAFKVVNGVWFRIDPTQFLQPVLDQQVTVEFDCNYVAVYVGGVAMERQSLLESTEVVVEMIGEPLVESE